ncbi:pyruvate, phosphate dikinase [Candidatus Woesearchaeota archaeon]|nr:pyruvate, phosphate dikinase [Candidatus Woesearchaeota archaeon]
MPKYVYSFEEGNKDMKHILGGKGANLSEMTLLGIPVPPGFTITTEVCDLYYKSNRQYPKEVHEQVEQKLRDLEVKSGKRLGSKENPLLVSVRSGAAASMPGMMDTILNLGLNDDTLKGLVKQTNNERFALDCYRRFIQMFGNVVLKISHDKFENMIEQSKRLKGTKLDTELNVDDLKKITDRYKILVKSETGRYFPEDPKTQLRMAIDAVFDSWNNDRAAAYRRIHDIKGLAGTAVNVQEMVFGNIGEDSGTGVAFTRNPATGDKKIFGEFLINAQGEDVVAGIRTPEPIEKMEAVMPNAYEQILSIKDRLERHYKDMQDIEFTIERGRLFILQTRNGKRTANAAVKAAVDMAKEGLITEDEAILRIEPSQVDMLLHKSVDPNAKSTVIARGLAASPGAASGEAYFSAAKAKGMAEEGRSVILVRNETSPEDIEGMHSAQGILTARGGVTSHAAVVSRGMGKPCIVGAESLAIDENSGNFSADGMTVREGEKITIDGTSGAVMLGEIPLTEPEFGEEFRTLMKWADSVRMLKVRANADTPEDAGRARELGAEGIGLCRTEHMFFEQGRIRAMREMMLADTTRGRKKALEKLLPMQKSDFKGIFRAMNGFPVNIRLLDPPLHEFLPKEKEEISKLAYDMEVSEEKINELLETTREFNPMLGFRGCRLGVVYPEIFEMQVMAIIEAACECADEGVTAIPEIMIPLTGTAKEFELLHGNINKAAEEAMGLYSKKINYSIGTMIEVPRACLVADKLAENAKFLSFGTNDLTQMTFGYSRDDSGRFLKAYVEKGVLEKDPFVAIDTEGVGYLMKLAVVKARNTNMHIKIGVCGEHGGDPDSVEFCHKIGLDYVSCSPYRVPIARLAAAQAVLKEQKIKESSTA